MHYVSSGQVAEPVHVSTDSILIRYGADDIRFISVWPEILEIDYYPGGERDTFSPVISSEHLEYDVFSAVDSGSSQIMISMGSVELFIELTPFRFTIRDNQINKEIRSGIIPASFNGDNFSGYIPAEHYYGVRNNRSGGLTFSGWAPIRAGSQGEAGAPFLWSPGGFGILSDADAGSVYLFGDSLNLNKSGSIRQSQSLFVFSGSVQEIFYCYHMITGFPPIPPKWALGFLNSEWGMDQSELLQDVQTYSQKQIPLDAYILDFDWMDYGEDQYGEFRWNGSKFPLGPSGLLKDSLEKYGVKLMGIRKPRIHLNTEQGQLAEQNGYFYDYTTDYFTGQQVGRLDFYQEDVRAWFWDNFIHPARDSYQRGIVGYWNDEADEYNGALNFLYMQQSQYHGQRTYNNNRVFSLNRNYFAGAHRFAYGHWSGDIGTGFSSMAAQPVFMLSSVLLGSSWWSMDIGGFHGTPTAENYYRWIQMGSFIPVFRVHGTYNEEREPWNYGIQAEQIATEFIQLRYQLMPYLYQQFVMLHEIGIPPVRPLMWDFPEDLRYTNYSQGWMFGEDIIVFPVLGEGIRKLSVPLPQGEWVEFFTDQTLVGGGTVEIPVSVATVPVMVRSGSIIPMDPNIGSRTDSASWKQISFHIYGSGADSCIVYEDDGITYDYESQAYTKTRYVHQSSYKKEIIYSEEVVHNYSIKRDWEEFVFHSLQGTGGLARINGMEIPYVEQENYYQSQDTVWTIFEQNKRIYVNIPGGLGSSVLEILKDPDPTPPAISGMKLLADTLLEVRFTSNVRMDSSSTGALNPSNYLLQNPVQLVSAKPDPTHSTGVLLFTTAHEEGNYELTVRNISSRINPEAVMEDTTLHYWYYLGDTRLVRLQNGLNGYTGCSDAHIMEYIPNNNTGANPVMEFGRYSGTLEDDKSILIRFELEENGEILTGVVDSAFLWLTVSGFRNGENPKTMSCAPLLKSWNEGFGEGIDGVGASSGEVTWLEAQKGVDPWLTPGGDYETPIDRVIVFPVPDSQVKVDITDAAKLWLSRPESNFGVILFEENPSLENGTIQFYSSQSNDPDKRPRLVLAFRPLPLEEKVIPTSVQIGVNYPNPFNPVTRIPFTLNKPETVVVRIYNIEGKLINTMKKTFDAGTHTISLNFNGESSGIYFANIRAGKLQKTLKLLFLK